MVVISPTTITSKWSTKVQNHVPRYIGTLSCLYCTRVLEIAYGFGGPSGKNCQSSFIFYCKMSILCQSLQNLAQYCRSFLTGLINFVNSAVLYFVITEMISKLFEHKYLLNRFKLLLSTEVLPSFFSYQYFSRMCTTHF